MSQRLPQPLQDLVDQLRHLPGLGSKSALRIAMTLLAWPRENVRRLGSDIEKLRDQLGLCSRCGGISANDPCSICGDKTRESHLLCIVPEWDSLLALEQGNFYRGQYLVLGGLLEPTLRRDSSSLNLEQLARRLREEDIREVILALGSTLEAENTASFLKEFLNGRFPDVAVTRLAQGMPLGALVKFMDKETLAQSMKYRQKL